jgi:Mg2+-importing ATPase
MMVMRGAPENVYGSAFTGEVVDWARNEGIKGCRILAVAYKEIHEQDKQSVEPEDEYGFTVAGMVSFTDPLKSSTRHALKEANKLGVQVKIITGDSKEVAGWVGVEAGIIDNAEEVLSSDVFSQMTEAEKLVAVDKYHVFARTLPLQKYEIISLLKHSHLVGFLGEGFNDAPALKMAHVGLAVENASDIAQDASDVILLNKSLDVIIDGIKEGRVIFANSMKYLRSTLASNFGNFYALAFSSLFISYLPMLPIQVLLLNLLSDFPMISISTDNVDDEELKSPKGYQVAELTSVAIALGIVSTIFDFSFFGYFVNSPDERVLQTMWFMGSILTELVVLFSIRTILPFWRGKRPSMTVVLLTGTMAVVTVMLPFVPMAQRVFGFIRPEPEYLYITFGLVALYFISNEVVKLLFYRFWNAKETRHAGLG